MIYRWGISLTIVIAMAVVTAGCAKRKLYGSQFSSGYVYCNGPIGNFNVVLTRSDQDPGEYALQVQPLEVPQAGTLLHIAIANSNNSPPYRDLKTSTQIARGQTLDLGLFTRDDIKLYPYLVMVPYDGNTDPNFLANSASKGILCALPTTDNETQYPL